MKKILAILMATVLFTALLCGCSSGVSEGADSPEVAIESYLNAYMEADTEEALAMLPPQIAEPFYVVNKDKMESINEGVKKSLNGQETSFELGEKIKMSDEEKVRYEKRLTSSASAYAEVLKKLNMSHEIKIEEAYDVKVTLKNGGNKNKTSFPVGKIDGKWYVLLDNPAL